MNTSTNLIFITLLSLCFSATTAAKGMGNNANRAAQMPTFSEIDTNQDLLISQEEFNQFRAKRQSERKSEGKMLRNADKNASMFTRMDTNSDTMIDMDEFTNHRQSMRKSNKNTW